MSQVLLPEGIRSVDPVDRDSRVLGRVKLLDTGGTPYKGLTDAELRAAAVAVDTELAAAAALADSAANPTVPGVGAYGIVFDGTNWHRQRGSGAGTKVVISDGVFGAEKGVAGNPFTIAATPIAAAEYKKYVTGEITLATATGVQELLTLWHPSASAVRVAILAIRVHFRVVQTAGTFAFEAQFITAENGTPGGTTVNGQGHQRAAATALTARSQVTGAPTTTGNLLFKRPFPLPAAAAPNVQQDGFKLHESIMLGGDAIQLRASTAEGIRLTANVAATLTTAPVVVVEVLTYEV